MAGVVSSYLWSALPARAAAAAAAARHGRQHGERQREPLLLSLRFVIETDGAGAPVQPEPLRQVAAPICTCMMCVRVAARFASPLSACGYHMHMHTRAGAAAAGRAAGLLQLYVLEAATLCIQTASLLCVQVELWCQLAGWGLVRVGTVPVTYDNHFRCTFPEISEAVLHSVPHHGQKHTHPSARPLAHHQALKSLLYTEAPSGMASAELAAYGSRRPLGFRAEPTIAWVPQCSPGASPRRRPKRGVLLDPGAQRCRGAAPHRTARAVGARGQPRHQGRKARPGRRRTDGGEAHPWVSVNERCRGCF